MHDIVPAELSERWRRFTDIHYSDWYFNRAIWRLGLGLQWLHDPSSLSENDRKRDNIYQAKASFNAIKAWKKVTQLEGMPSLENRKLVPSLLFKDQKQLLRLREAPSYEFILNMMQQLLPYHAANVAINQEFRSLYREILLSVDNKRHIAAFLLSVKRSKFITPIVKERMTLNAKRLLMEL